MHTCALRSISNTRMYTPTHPSSKGTRKKGKKKTAPRPTRRFFFQHFWSSGEGRVGGSQKSNDITSRDGMYPPPPTNASRFSIPQTTHLFHDETSEKIAAEVKVSTWYVRIFQLLEGRIDGRELTKSVRCACACLHPGAYIRGIIKLLNTAVCEEGCTRTTVCRFFSAWVQGGRGGRRGVLIIISKKLT